MFIMDWLHNEENELGLLSWVVDLGRELGLRLVRGRLGYRCVPVGECLSRAPCNGMHGPAGNIMSMISCRSCSCTRTLPSLMKTSNTKWIQCTLLFCEEDVYSMWTMPISFMWTLSNLSIGLQIAVGFANFNNFRTPNQYPSKNILKQRNCTWIKICNVFSVVEKHATTMKNRGHKLMRNYCFPTLTYNWIKKNACENNRASIKRQFTSSHLFLPYLIAVGRSIKCERWGNLGVTPMDT